MTSPMSTQTSLDKYIAYCQSNRILLAKTEAKLNIYNSAAVVIGNFAFDCHCHSTGNSVQVWALNGKESRQIVNTTYWFYSRYCFNNSKWENGPWDKALDEAISYMIKTVDEHREMTRKAEEEAELARWTKELEEKNKWAKVFSN